MINRHKIKKTQAELSKLIPSFVGNGVHEQLQKYLKMESQVNNNWLIERNVLLMIDDVRLSGRFDALYTKEVLYDIKVSKAYKYIKGDYKEWTEQLNVYDYMLWKDGISLKSLKVFMVISDWNQGESYQKGYPSTNINIVTLPQWAREDQERWIKTRMNLWKSSKDLNDVDLPLCTQEDRWASKAIYKLYKTKEAKRAYKVFTDKAYANNYLNKIKSKPEMKDSYVVPVVGDAWRRCNWCEVSSVCNQYQNKLEV